MRNIQVIDGADNCTYDIYAVTEEEFEVIFPDGRDVEFVEHLIARVGEARAGEISSAMWKRPVDKKTATGIQGTLFYELLRKVPYYPTKKESEAIPLEPDPDPF